MLPRRLILSAFILVVSASCAEAQEAVDYLRDVKPILAQNCLSCHGPKVCKGKLRIDTAAFLLKGGKSGPAVVPGRAAESPLIQALKGSDGFTAMPLNKSALPQKYIAIIAKWINEGAKAPPDEVADDGTGRNHWSFKPPQRGRVPTVKDTQWPRNPIDAFVLAPLESAGIKPSPQADQVTLIRRVYLDLLGLPPRPQEVDAFLADTRPDAYERMVDRLLASPHYGERWGRHWLDLARYADTHGYSVDGPREVWKYRDWVIDALNRDMPFDQFVIEQMAGDLLPGTTVSQKIATGFHRNTMLNQEGGVDVEQFRVEGVADRVNTVGTVFLGLTLGCARCHDHKFDPLSQREYYRLFAFLNNQNEATLTISGAEADAYKKSVAAKLARMEDELDGVLHNCLESVPEKDKDKLEETIHPILRLPPGQRSDAQKKTLSTFFSKLDTSVKGRFDAIAAVKKNELKAPTALVLEEMSKGRETHIHLGGDFTRKGDVVSPGVPGILHALAAKDSPNRLDLARWLVDRKNPLLGRVTVNRLWQHYFGKGLVETENDFGTQALPPTHPELLDWLACEFEDSWSLKAMHRLIVTSATYRQSSRARPDLVEVDANNRLLARQTRLRLDAEIVRDNALAASGLLSHRLGGPSVFPPQPGGIYQFTQVVSAWQTSTGDERYRRGLYTYFKRSAPYPSLTVFDAPDATSTCTRRIRSNTPLQALTLLNDQAFLEMAQGLAQSVLASDLASDKDRVRHAFRLCLAREPRPRETELLLKYLKQQLEEFRAAPDDARAFLLGEAAAGKPLPKQLADFDIPRQAAWTALARILLNLDEFITRE
jgi:hypothetical protein